MKLFLTVAIAIWVTVCTHAQSPVVKWATTMGGAGNDRANCIEIDAKGNMIVVGRFQSKTMTAGSVVLTKSPADIDESADIFIIKLDKKGRVLWAVSAGDYGDDHALSCVTDANGNIYVVGWFESQTITFDQFTLKNHNFTAGKDSVRYNSDMWVAKFSPEGKCIWAKNAGGLDGNGQYSTITLDPQNNVIISGIGGEEMTFDDGIKRRNEISGMFVAKYANDGKLLWVELPSGKGEAQGVSTDAQGNIFIAGYFINSVSFDDITLKSYAEKTGDAFVAKFSPDGQVIWARNFGGDNGEIASCETDPSGNVYLSGVFFSKNIVYGTDTLKNNGLTNHFIVKFNKDGTILWAKSAGGNNGEGPATATREFYVDTQGNAYCTGSNWSSFTFAGKSIDPVAGSEDIFLLKYDTNGNELWGVDYGGSGRNAGRGIILDKKGDIFLTGSYEEKQLTLGSYTLSNAGDSDIFIVKLSEPKK